MKGNGAKIICKNVFKNYNDGKEAVSREFTLKWIELINTYEKNKPEMATSAKR